MGCVQVFGGVDAIVIDAVTGDSIQAMRDPGIDLSALSHADKDALVASLLPLVGKLRAALARIAELEKRLAAFERPPKNPDNSSVPPSRGQKSDRPTGDKPSRTSRPGVGRALVPLQSFSAGRRSSSRG